MTVHCDFQSFATSRLCQWLAVRGILLSRIAPRFAQQGTVSRYRSTRRAHSELKDASRLDGLARMSCAHFASGHLGRNPERMTLESPEIQQRLNREVENVRLSA
jgi:hypothetical protein